MRRVGAFCMMRVRGRFMLGREVMGYDLSLWGKNDLWKCWSCNFG